MTLVQVAQHADDLERAVAFYVSALGARAVATFDPPGLAFVRLGQVRVMFDRGAPSTRLYVGVDDARSAVARHRAAGVDVVSDAHAVYADDDGLFGPAGTVEWQAFVRDTEGNLIGLVSRHPTDAD